MTPQQIIACLMYNREFVAVGATLLALVYGAIIEARGKKQTASAVRLWRRQF